MSKKSNSKIKAKANNLSLGSKIWRILVCIAIPLGGGLIISMFTRNAMGTFNSFNQPPLSPPAWLFPVAWTILYILMGIASFLIFYHGRKTKENTNLAKTALCIYGLQLIFNFGLTLIFFNFSLFWPAFFWLLTMWILIIALIVKTRAISMPAFYMLLPYLTWTTFAAYLNFGIAILN